MKEIATTEEVRRESGVKVTLIGGTGRRSGPVSLGKW